MTEPAIVAMVDAAMAEMINISPPLRRSECERLIRAAIGARPDGPEPQPGAGNPSKPVKIVRLHLPAITVRPGSMLVDGEAWPDGSREILLDDFVAVRVNYRYPYTDNLSVQRLANQIKVLLEGGKAVPR